MIDDVSALIRTIGTEQVMSRFRSLADGDVEEKAPGDLVTVADRECERALTAELRAIRDVPVVGEEAAAADPDLLGLLSGDAAWVIDPVDGTANFVAGSTDFAVMVALVEQGEATAGWIWHPVADRMLVAERGSGAWSDTTRIVAPPSEPADLSGIAKTKYIPEPDRTRVRTRLAADSELAVGIDRGCAGLEYADIIDRRIGFLFYWRTKPWDHAPGTLIASEAGLRAARLDGGHYRPGDGATGLLTAVPTQFVRAAKALRP